MIDACFLNIDITTSVIVMSFPASSGSEEGTLKFASVGMFFHVLLRSPFELFTCKSLNSQDSFEILNLIFPRLFKDSCL